MTKNSISGGSQVGPVLQGRDFINTTIITNQAPAAPTALAQLPPSVQGFTGRSDELAEVSALLNPSAGGEAVVVSAVAGLAGVGKTALAIQAGHTAQQKGWFSGGVLFIDLHGYDHNPVQPSQALEALLRSLGVPTEHIPDTEEQRAGLYRSQLAHSNDPVLILADNASSEAQVRLLLPGSGPHRVLITSRHTLGGLDARLLEVKVLEDDTGVALLDKALRIVRPVDRRVSSDRMAALKVAQLCGGLPLALRITAAVLVAEPTLAMSDLAAELADEMNRLEVLQYDDGGGTSAPSVAAAFELSYRQLGEEAKRMFRLLPVNPGPDVSISAAAALLGQSNNRTRRILGQVSKAHLIESAARGKSRWRMHDLLRLYAQQLSDAYAQADERDQATVRLLDFYTKKTESADWHIREVPTTPAPIGFKDRNAALEWLDIERESLISAVSMAVRLGNDRIVAELPMWLSPYLSRRRLFDDEITVNSASLDVARRHRNRIIELASLNNLSLALRNTRRFEEAVKAIRDCVSLARKSGEKQIEGMALNNLGTALREMKSYKQSIRAHRRAAALYKKAGDRHGEAAALNNLGTVLRLVERPGDSIQAYLNSAALYRDTGDRHGEGKCLSNFSASLLDIGRLEEGISVSRAAVAIFRETGDRYGEGAALNNLGVALQLADQAAEAMEVLREAVVAFREVGDAFREKATMDVIRGFETIS